MILLASMKIQVLMIAIQLKLQWQPTFELIFFYLIKWKNNIVYLAFSFVDHKYPI
jgi:hypothetical protein